MALRYDPKDAVQVWPAGEYDADLEGVEEKTSAAGNDMEVWSIRVYSDDGRTQLVTEYVVVPSATFKIKQLAIALGKKDEFDAGTFQAENNIGAGFRVTLKIEAQKGFDDKNRIQNYKPATTGQETPHAAPPRPAASHASAGPSQKPPSTTEPPYQPTGIPDDQIPFAIPGRITQPL